MSLTSNERLQEVLSLALEDRSPGYADLVSNSNAILHTLKKKGMMKTYSGPKIRKRLQFAQSGTYTRYSHLQFLNPKRKELFNDAEFEPKLAAVSVALSGEDILKNSGEAQLLDIMEEKMTAGEMELKDRFVEDFHSAGSAENQIGGLQLAIPTDPTVGTYGGIDRSANAIWRTSAYDAHSYFAGQTQVTSTNVHGMFRTIVNERSRNTQGPDLICAAYEHFSAYDDGLLAVQRINDENELGKRGFSNLMFYGAGKRIPVVLEGGIGTAMPANVTYFLDSDGFGFEYHEDRNFKQFG
ncbi:MAG: phage major capsid protein, partial [Pseudomonadota bacterium]